ncbi:gephyrin-like molybdotransferase Glp [Nitrincola sp. MINF-07-Sa-05]|uniref:molybdopterin molybdotransferase MoeA n=1 Tax=Nitrincola salilacus TaxID=3400273 RepID=UPI0039181E0D
MTEIAAPSCFDYITPGNRHLTLEEGVELILSAVTARPAIESIELQQASGRLLVSDIVAPMNVPQRINSAMDGFALKGAELKTLDQWQVLGEQLAGQDHSFQAEAGQAVRITTGAPMPSGTDTVVMKEMTQQQGNLLQIKDADRIKIGSNVRRAGEDIRQGSSVLKAGQSLGPVEIGLLASLGFARIEVFNRVSVAIFSTGDEVTLPGQPLGSSGIYDTNRFTLHALLQALGCDVQDLGIIPDDPDAVYEALDSIRGKVDLVVTSGGVSVGEADFIKQALASLGSTGFWQLAIRPGRPLAFGQLGQDEDERRSLFMGLPGNPVAVMVTAMLLVQPLIRRLQGQTGWSPTILKAVSDEKMVSRRGRSDFHRGVFYNDEQGLLRVRTTGSQGSGILTSMQRGNCLIRIADDQAEIEPGAVAEIYPFYSWLPGFTGA